MRKTAKILALVLGAAYAIGVAGCGEKEKTYDIPRDQYGFVCKPVDYGCLPRETYKCAYRILEEEYDKSNVKIQVGYGDLYGLSAEKVEEDLIFKMYMGEAGLSEPWGEHANFMKNIDGVAYFSENYLVDGEKRADGAIIYLFRHTEIVKIPEELFSKPEGELLWFIQADEEYRVAAFTVNYQMTGNKVVLSVPERYFE